MPPPSVVSHLFNSLTRKSNAIDLIEDGWCGKWDVFTSWSPTLFLPWAPLARLILACCPSPIHHSARSLSARRAHLGLVWLLVYTRARSYFFEAHVSRPRPPGRLRTAATGARISRWILALHTDTQRGRLLQGATELVGHSSVSHGHD